MFTGIVRGMGKVETLEQKDNFRKITVRFPEEMLSALERGASVANNGCCLTVTDINHTLVSFDIIEETLRVTNLGLLRVGDQINLERAACFGDEIGGHQMSGHILCMADVQARENSADNAVLWIELPEIIAPYVFHKGYIGIDGISLTVGEVNRTGFCVHLIPETLQRTVINNRGVGDKVNIEIDPQTQVIVDTVRRYMLKM